MSILKYKTCYSDIYGRYFVADKDIVAGEIILREEPTVIGPLNVENKFLCFACMKSIFNPEFVCLNCKVAPLCSELCQKWQTLHVAEECELFEKNREVMKNDLNRLTEILAHLRVWFIYKNNKKLWEEINQMEAHLNERRGKSIWNHVEKILIKFFEDYNIIPLNDAESAELIQKISGILDVNTFEVRSQTDINEIPLRGLYLESSLMAHNCISNTHLTVDDEFRLTIYASVPILKDKMICFNYTSPLMGFAERQIYLREGKYFKCSCTLCQDLTEGNSNLSTILCAKCKKGLVTMENALEKYPYIRSTKWKCQNCSKMLSGCLINTTLNISENLVSESENNVQALESVLKKLSSTLHTNHFIMLKLKQKLLGVYKQEIESSYVERHYLQRMIQVGNELLEVVNILEPGISRLKGILLYELHLPMVILANREYSLQEISLDMLIDKLLEGRNFLKKSLNIMLLEPPTSPEGLLAREAMRRLKNINQNIKDVQSLAEN